MPGAVAMTRSDPSLPSGYIVRTPTSDDAQAVYDLVAACALAETGVVGSTYEEVRTSLEGAADSGADAIVILSPDNDRRIIARATVTQRSVDQLWTTAEVHPRHQGNGLGAYLLRWTQAHMDRWSAGKPPGIRLVGRQQILATNVRARALLEASGYHVARRHWRMRIELREAPAISSWPEGVTIRTFIPGQDDYAVYRAAEEAFSDHWDYAPEEFADYADYFQSAGFDPSLNFLAMHGQDIAGVALCQQREERETQTTVALGWIDSLSVRRPYRRRGIALALLRHIFGEFYRRGSRQVALFVDAQSETSAIDLYRAAGMYPFREWIEYEKEARSVLAGASEN
jgi:mycothiol synthase